MNQQFKDSAATSHPVRPRRGRISPVEDRGRQLIRLLHLLRALESATRGMTVRELLEELDLDCTERTIYRDLDHLKQAGFQVTVENHRYRLEGSSVGVEPLTPSQVLAVLLTRELYAPLRGYDLTSGLHSLADSLMARLRPEGRRWLEELRPTVAVTWEVPVQPLNPEVLDTLQEAQVTEQCLEIDYSTPGKSIQTRVVEPHLLWYRGGKAYLVGYCREKAGFRTFALPRISRARLLDETFDRRPDFNTEQFIAYGFGVFHGPAHEVTVRFEKQVAHLAQERRWHPTQEVSIEEDGRALLRMKVGGLPEIAAWIASFGGQLTAISPSELVEQVKALHRAGLEKYSSEEI